MISFEVQKNKLIFSKGHQKVIVAGEDYKKFKKILGRISRGLKSLVVNFLERLGVGGQ